MIYGARQVGKAYLIRDIFAERFYPGRTIYINFKFDDDMRDFVNGEGVYSFHTSNASKIIDHLSLRENREIDSDTLLIFSEIQEAMPAITALKDFKENHPEIPVIASGSLVRIKIRKESKRRSKKEKFFYPVGSLEELALMPMNSEEFLMNANPMLFRRVEEAYARKTPLDDSAHHLALSYLHDYLLVGSLPESIAIFLETKSRVAARKNLVTVYQDYLNDIDLYDVPTGTALRTRKLFDNLYLEINRPHADFKPSLFDEGKKSGIT